MSNYINQYEQISSIMQNASNKNDALRSIGNIRYDSGPKIGQAAAKEIYNSFSKNHGEPGRRRR